MCKGLGCGSEMDHETPGFHYKSCHIFQYFRHKFVLWWKLKNPIFLTLKKVTPCTQMPILETGVSSVLSHLASISTFNQLPSALYAT